MLKPSTFLTKHLPLFSVGNFRSSFQLASARLHGAARSIIRQNLTSNNMMESWKGSISYSHDAACSFFVLHCLVSIYLFVRNWIWKLSENVLDCPELSKTLKNCSELPEIYYDCWNPSKTVEICKKTSEIVQSPPKLCENF